MTYQRKTRDVYHIFVNYGYGDGWEHEATEFSWRDARAQLKTYRENCPQYSVKAQRRREKIEQSEVQSNA